MIKIMIIDKLKNILNYKKLYKLSFSFLILIIINFYNYKFFYF